MKISTSLKAWNLRTRTHTHTHTELCAEGYRKDICRTIGQYALGQMERGDGQK